MIICFLMSTDEMHWSRQPALRQMSKNRSSVRVHPEGECESQSLGHPVLISHPTPSFQAAAPDEAAWPFTTFDQDWRNSLTSRIAALERANQRMAARWSRVHGEVSDDSGGEEQMMSNSPQQLRSPPEEGGGGGQPNRNRRMVVDENGAGPSSGGVCELGSCALRRCK